MRLIELLNERSSDRVTLFRGDSMEIDQYKIDKTDPGGMVGSGIYLTTSFDVAKDYTVKGTSDVLYRSEQGEGDNPREFVFQTFMKNFYNITRPVIEEFYWGIASKVRKMSDIFRHEINSTIGTGNQATEHPRHQELRMWYNTAMEYAEAYLWVSGEKQLMQILKQLYQQEYDRFKSSFKNTRMLKTVLDELIIIPEDKLGHVSRFRVPTTYLNRTYRVDDPLSDGMIKWVISYMRQNIKNFDPSRSLVDMRYNDPQKGEVRAKSFRDWITNFKTYGARYAWGDHTVGGQDVNPSLMEIIYGTHTGLSLLHQNNNYQLWKDLQKYLEHEGYVGFHYNGGNRTGNNTYAGGSPVKHDAYVLWDERNVDGFRVGSKEIGVDSTDKRLFTRFRFDHVVKDVASRFTPYKELVKKNRPHLVNVSQIEADINQWLATGALIKRMEKHINETS